jgi:hypothetical protein
VGDNQPIAYSFFYLPDFRAAFQGSVFYPITPTANFSYDTLPELLFKADKLTLSRFLQKPSIRISSIDHVPY